MTIPPTIGRVVWYWPNEHDTKMVVHNPEQPMKADIVFVWSPTLVNLSVIDHVGYHHPRASVELIAEGTFGPGSGRWGWMPYQIGQAKKHEAEATKVSGFAGLSVNTESTEANIEKQIQAKGLTAPRLTPSHIDDCIVSEAYHVFPGTTVTVCALTLQNGYVVIGKSAAASRENFDPDIGKQIARADARNQIWALEGYLLRSRLEASGK